MGGWPVQEIPGKAVVGAVSRASPARTMEVGEGGRVRKGKLSMH